MSLIVIKKKEKGPRLNNNACHSCYQLAFQCESSYCKFKLTGLTSLGAADHSD